MNFHPFPEQYRASGLLLHVTSLPSPYGIGDLGPGAFTWIDRLHDADQSWWQVLPLGPTGYGNSPYQPLSSFAGNGMLISPEGLIEDGLLRAADCEGRSFSATAVDYNAVIPFKQGLLDKVWTRFKSAASPELKYHFEKFCEDQGHWLDDYALFRALKNRYHGAYYLEWPLELVQRGPAALVQARRELTIQIDQVCLAQFLMFRQWARLKAYAGSKGVRLIGDLPFFVSSDSSDVWVNPGLFLLDERGRPRFVAGVPPDYFTALGQLWGNPTYDWDALRQTEYRWCIERLRAVLTQVDVIRLDHFRAFSAAWHIPAGAPTAQGGEWVLGPGAEFFRTVESALGPLPFLAEDLGLITPDVRALRNKFHLPGTRVLQFAFDGAADNPDLPHNYVPNTAVYTGTHDNPTTRAWYEGLPSEPRSNLWKYLGLPEWDNADAAAALVHVAWSSRAALAMAPLQDVLNLGADARMNTPGQPKGNWRWRFTEDMLLDSTFQRLKDLTIASGRAASVKDESAAPVMEVVS